jgi:threonyl-tRNA synthetase
MLTRVYGLAFETKKELDDYLKMQEESEKRDHRKLGAQLELFMFHETAPGMAYWLPKGLIILNELLDFWRKEHLKCGYQEIKSPLLNKKELYEISGHWDHYREEMFLCQTEEKETYALKPMNCPNAMVVFGSKTRSYRDLPLRLSDCDMLHRYERSGTLNGLLRVREITQDDAHIFISEDQIKEECQKILEIAEKFYSIFNLEYSFRLGTRPESFMGDEKSWDKAEKELEEILKSSEKPFVILRGDGAFYGPKIDILMKDSLGRQWQMGTIQLDFQIPKKFKLTFADKDGKEKTPVVIHRVIYGSLERFIGVLTEHYAGAFPFWLAPVQMRIIPISDKHIEYANKTKETLSDFRVEVDAENETVGKKIRNGELQKIPYLLVVGDKEISAGTVAVRERGKKEIETLELSKFIEKLCQQYPNKRKI